MTLVTPVSSPDFFGMAMKSLIRGRPCREHAGFHNVTLARLGRLVIPARIAACPVPDTGYGVNFSRYPEENSLDCLRGSDTPTQQAAGHLGLFEHSQLGGIRLIFLVLNIPSDHASSPTSSRGELLSSLQQAVGYPAAHLMKSIISRPGNWISLDSPRRAAPR